MTTIQKDYINALLADASYVDLTQGMSKDDLILELSERMTPTLAAYIAANFEVASSINSPDIPLLGSGFDATVWRGKAGTAFAGQVFVSTRGTEPPGVDIWGADADLATNVAARSQIIDMVNWWLRGSASTTEQARQLLWQNEIRAADGQIVQPEGYVLGVPAAGTGELAGVTAVQINGHSLGGHLAAAFARIFGGNTGITGSVDAQGVATFNSAGFNANAAEPFFQQLQAVLGTGLSNFAAVSARQTNFFAQNGINVTTNTWWFTQMGSRVGLNQEETTGMGNHSMYRITDLLALGAALEKLDPTLTIDKLNELVKAGSHMPAASLEGVFDGLRLMLDPAATRLTAGDAKDSDPARKAYHQTLSELQTSPAFTTLVGQLLIRPASADLKAAARNDFSAVVALQDLSPFWATGKDAAADAELARHWNSTRHTDSAGWIRTGCKHGSTRRRALCPAVRKKKSSVETLPFS